MKDTLLGWLFIILVVGLVASLFFYIKLLIIAPVLLLPFGIAIGIGGIGCGILASVNRLLQKRENKLRAEVREKFHSARITARELDKSVRKEYEHEVERARELEVKPRLNAFIQEYDQELLALAEQLTVHEKAVADSDIIAPADIDNIEIVERLIGFMEGCRADSVKEAYHLLDEEDRRRKKEEQDAAKKVFDDLLKKIDQENADRENKDRIDELNDELNKTRIAAERQAA